MECERNRRRLFFISTVVLVLVGCGPQIQEPGRVCPGRESAGALLSILRARSQDTAPIKANGQCLATFYADGKAHKENFPVKLWLNPPFEVRLQGDIGFNARALVVGSNEDEFWLSIKPEISSYWWGKWSEQDSLGNVKIDPKLVLEAFGAVEIEDDENWSLSNEGGFDVLTKRDGQGAVTKKMYVHSCSFVISKIEYFHGDGQAGIVAELSEYKEVGEGFSVPTAVKIASGNPDGTEDSFRITLGSVRGAEFTGKKKTVLFGRSVPRGFEHVYEIIGGRCVERP